MLTPLIGGNTVLSANVSNGGGQTTARSTDSVGRLDLRDAPEARHLGTAGSGRKSRPQQRQKRITKRGQRPETINVRHVEISVDSSTTTVPKLWPNLSHKDTSVTLGSTQAKTLG